MPPAIRVFDAAERWDKPPGSVGRQVRWAVGAAVWITLAIALVGPHAVGRYLRDYADDRADRFWIENGLALGVVVLLAPWLVVRGRLSRTVALAVVLPLVHLVALLGAWLLWRYLGLTDELPRARAWAPYAHTIPAIEVAVVLGAGVVALAAAYAACTRRVAAALHGVMVAALLALLLLGIWLPIAAEVWKGWAWMGPHTMIARDGLATCVLAPPLVLATLLAVAIERWPAAMRRARTGLVAVAALLFVYALCCRAAADSWTVMVYNNFIHVVMAAAVFAVCAIAAVGVATLIARARSRAMFAGPTVSGTLGGATRPVPDVHARAEIASWLRAPRVVTGEFVVETAAGAVPVPRDFEVVAPLPAITTRLATGEAAVVLAAGDRVRLAGFVDPAPDHPYRRAAVPVPGQRGIFVEPIAGEPASGLIEVALALWRPCVCYLVTMALTGTLAVIAAASQSYWR